MKNNKNINRVVVPVVLVAGIFIGGVVVLRTQGIGAQILSEGKKIFVPVASDSEADPDNDGLKNWEEEIHKTDPRNPDTDGDGYLDGEEVASGYDPTIPAPNDALAGTDTNQPRPLPKNLTDHLAQILTQKIAAGEIAPAQGDKLNSSDPNIPYNQEIMQEALYQIGLRAKEQFILIQPNDSDIKVSANQTTGAEIGAYAAAMAQAMEKDPATAAAINLSESDIFKEAIETKNTDKIQLLLISLQKNIKAIKEITAPRDLADIHKKQLGIFILYEKVLDAIRNFQDDPAMAMAAIDTYPKIIDMMQGLSEELFVKIEKYQNNPVN